MAAAPSFNPCDGDEVWAATEQQNLESQLAFFADRDGVALADSMASLVLGVDVDGLSQEGRLAAIAVADRAMAAMAAKQAELMVKVAEVERAEQDALEVAHPSLVAYPVAEPEREPLALALDVSPRSASARLNHAWVLCQELPNVWWAQRWGRISQTTARVLVQATASLPNERAQAVAGEVLATGFTTTPGSVRRRAERLAARVDPRHAQERHEEATSQRCVITRSEGDGMASLWWLADAATIGQARDLIDATARHALDARTGASDGIASDGIDAARSDALAALLFTVEGDDGVPPGSSDCPSPHSTSTRRRPVIAVHVGLSTLLGHNDAPAEVPGLGFIPARQARELAANSDWHTFLHSADGRLAAIGTKAYTPTDAMTALVIARDRTCQFPGCNEPAHRCDIDHIQPYNHHNPAAGGPTEPGNLQALCRRHHNLKTSGTWHIAHNPDGTTTWSGPRRQQARIEHDPDPP